MSRYKFLDFCFLRAQSHAPAVKMDDYGQIIWLLRSDVIAMMAGNPHDSALNEAMKHYDAYDRYCAGQPFAIQANNPEIPEGSP
jgi:hypothetical protein